MTSPRMFSIAPRRLPLCSVFLLLALCLTSGLYAAEHTASSVLVRLRADITPAQFLASLPSGPVTQAHGLLPAQPRGARSLAVASPHLAALERTVVITPEPGTDIGRLIEQIRGRGDVESAEPNTIRRIDLSQRKTLALVEEDRTAEQWALTSVRAGEAWTRATGRGVIVGIVDTGIDFTHPEFRDRLHINTAEDANGNGTFEPWPASETVDGVTGDLDGIDNDGNGYIDDVIGYDFVDQNIANIGDARTRDPLPFDEHGHGTNVAGVIAARNDGNGITGAAYDSKLLTLRAFDATGNGEDDDFAAAIVYGALNGARVLNLSFGDIYFPPILRDAIAFAHDLGCVVVSSSGNNGSTRPHYPSDFTEVISVGSVSRTDALAQLSNRGSLVDMVAPGVNVLTTGLNGSYETVSGTSFAAPHVAAAAALLLQQRPSLTAREIHGLLTASADDLGDRGWDTFFGAGKLNMNAALELTADAAILISFPPLDYTANSAETAELTVRGSVFAPFFRSYTVDIAAEADADDTVWTRLAFSDRQISDGSLAVLPLAGRPNGVYIVRIRVEQTNGTTLERRQRFTVSNEPLAFSRLQVYNAWQNDRRVVVISARTNHRTRMAVRYRPKGSGALYREVAEVDRQTYYHTVVIGTDTEADVDLEAQVVAVTSGGDTATAPVELRRQSAAMPHATMRPLSYTLPQGFLLNATADFYGDGSTSTVIASTEDDASATRVFTFGNGAFAARDSVKQLWIPRGIGDSNGDGTPELFAQFGPRSVLFQNTGSSLFDTRLFSDDTDTSNFWASAMTDMDGNGREELLARSHESYMLYSYTDNAYSLRASTSDKLPAPDLATSTATGDFDGDGRMELCYGAAQGGLLILEYRDGGFATEYTIEEDYNGNYFMTALDVDSDGRQEILVSTYKGVASNNDREYDTPLWSFRLLRATAANSYEIAWQDYSYGVRPPSPYRSGIAAGNVNATPGDELILLAFPNAYVFTWDAAQQRIVPLWYYPAAMSNTAVVHDFNGNGTREFGFVTTDRVEFFEYNDTPDTRPTAPTGLEGYATAATEVALFWNASPQAQQYTVYGGVLVGGQAQIQALATTTATSVTLASLEPSTEYLFVVAAVNPALPQPTSAFSNDVVVFTHAPVVPESVQVIDRFSLRVYFSGDLPEKILQPSVFTLLDMGFPSTVVYAGNHSVILRFPFPLPSGLQTLRVTPFRDRYNAPTATGDLIVDIPPAHDTPELYLTAVRIVDALTLDLSFSEPVDPASASIAASYELAPTGAIVSAVPLDAGTVRLTLGSTTPLRPIGRNYVITVKDVRAASGHVMTTGPGKALGFTLEAGTIDDAYAYPNPVRLGEETSVFFGNLRYGAEVTVRTLDGAVVATVRETDGNGGVEWNCRSTSGELIGSGVYLFSVTHTGADGTTVESPMKKLAVVR